MPRNPLEWFGNKKFVLAIVALSVIIGGIVLAQGPLFHGSLPFVNGNSFNDPVTNIWKVTAPNNDLTEFNSQRVVFCTCTLAGMTSVPGFFLEPNASVTSVALTKSTVGDLGIIAAKQLFYRAQYALSGTCCAGALQQFGFYLTTNKTVPTSGTGTLTQYRYNTPTTTFVLRNDTNGQQDKVGGYFAALTPFNVVQEDWTIQRVGNPGGTVAAEIWSVSGVAPNAIPNTILATSQTLLASNIPTSLSVVSFIFSPVFQQGLGGLYFAVLDVSTATTDANNYFIASNAAITNSQNQANHIVAGSWSAVSTVTPNFAIVGRNVYNPYNDPSVTMLIQITPQGGANFVNTLFMQRTIGDTIKSEDSGGCAPSGSCFTSASDTIDPTIGPATLGVVLNFTTQGGSSGTCSGSLGGPGCSELAIGPGTSVPPTINAWSQQIPWFRFQGEQYYAGFYSLAPNNPGSTIFFNFEFTTGGGVFMPNDLAYYVPGPNCPGQANGPCNPDTGGFFGPVIKSLVSIGIFILNSIFGFIGFILPAIQQALGVLEQVLTQVLNFLSNLLWPNSNLGTLLAGFLNAIIQLFTNTSYGLPAFFANFPSYFTNFLAWLQITFPFLAPMFSIANAILGFAVSVAPTGITIMTLGLQMFLFGYGTLILASFFIYTGDDGIGGFLTFLGTLEALSFKILNIIATLTNLGLDILVIIISLIPKPFIQMSASKLPRLPTLETGASMSFPVMDLGEARNGNMVVYWLWSMGLYMLAWFESRNPSLPGSLGAIYAPLATNMRILSAYLPLLQAMVLISGGLLLAWTAMMPLRTIGFDIMGLSPFGVSLGRRTGAGPSTVKLAVGKKHVVGPAAKAEKERRRQKEFEEKKEEEARKGIVKHAKTQEEKRRSEELRKKEIERKPTGKDIKGPDLT